MKQSMPRSVNRRAGTFGLSLPVATLGLASSVFAQETLLVLEGAGIGDMYPVAGLADIDGDGFPELLVGLPGSHTAAEFAGTARVVSGGTGATLREHHGWAPYARLGQYVWDAGDFDGDGVGDYAAVGRADGTPPHGAGRVYIYSGASGAELASISGTQSGQILGKVFAAAGDVDGDGYGDVLISDEGVAAWLFRGPDLTLLRTHIAAGGGFASAAGLGDLDGDGYDDYVLGMPGSSVGGTATGRAVVYSGADGSVMHTVHGLQGHSGSFNGDQLGRSVTGVGDWNGDGVPDFAASAPGGSFFDLAEGFVRVYSGADAAVLAHIVRPMPASPWARFGDRIAGGHDVNGDGYPDLLVGASRESGPAMDHKEGSATAISGKDLLVLWKVYGDHQSSRIGENIDFVGDFNGDGYADFAVGDATYGSLGGVFVYGGAPMGTETYCPANPNTLGQAAHLFPEGHLKLRDDRFRIVLQGAIPSESALLFYGREVADLPFGDGRLCIAPPLFRLPPAQTVEASGEAAFRLALGEPPLAAGPAALLPGSSWSFQVWYRDPFSVGSGFNTSDALRILWAPN